MADWGASRERMVLIDGARILNSTDNIQMARGDTKHIEKRLAALEEELQSEPKRIRELYDVKHLRLERVGLVYLWPMTS